MSNDRIISDAMCGVPIRGELVRQRAAYETPLQQDKNTLQARCDETRQLLDNADTPEEQDMQTEAETQGIISKGQSRIRELKEVLKRAMMIKEAFQRLHGLPSEPIKPSVLLSSLLLGIMIFGEALINAAFFYNAHMSASPSAALLTSVLISATNILASCCAGFYIGRWLNWGENTANPNAPEFSKPRKRARFFHAISVGVMVFFHLSVGLIRSQESLSEIEHSLSAYLGLLQTPEAILLIITGVCLSVIAWFKGKSAFSDPYPLYSQHQKAVDDAREALADLESELQEELDEVFEEKIDHLDHTQKQQSKAISHYNKAVSQCTALHHELVQKVGTAQQQLAKETQQLIDSYCAAGGKAPPDFNLQAHCDFQSILDVVLPTPLPPPKPSPQKVQLQEAKAKVFEQLSTQFSGNDHSLQGEAS